MPVNGIGLFAHRGARITSAENTLEAFQRARAERVDGIECDLRVTRDGEPVIFHDEDGRRVAGSPGRIREMTWREVRELRVFGRHPVPHLKDVLDFMAGWPEAELFLDLHEDAAKILESVVRSVASAGLWPRCSLLDFYSARRLLLQARAMDGRARLSIMPGGPWNIAPSVGLGAQSLCVGWDGTTTRALFKAAGLVFDVPSAVAQARARGVAVSGGIANTAQDIRYVLAMGASGVWTDDLSLARETLAGVPSSRPSPGPSRAARPADPKAAD